VLAGWRSEVPTTYTDNTVAGLSFRSPTNLASNAAYAGVAITQTQMASQVATITTASAHGFRVGDMVTILFTDSSSYWGDATITAVPNATTTFQYSHTGADIAGKASPGVVALAYVAVLDNAMDTHLLDISYDKVEKGHFNNFFDMWDDENATIDHFNNQGIAVERERELDGVVCILGGEPESCRLRR
jgi:hypothetical protein